MPLGMQARREQAGQNKSRVAFADCMQSYLLGLTLPCRHAARTLDYVKTLHRNRGQVRGMLGDPS